MRLAFQEGADGLAGTLAEGDRVLVLGAGDAALAAARAVGMTGRVTVLAQAAGEREGVERARRRGGFYQVTARAHDGGPLPATAASIDAVVATPAALAGRPRAPFLAEVGRVLRGGGALVLLDGAGT